MRVEADRDLKRKEKMAATDKVSHVASAFEGEIKVKMQFISDINSERYIRMLTIIEFYRDSLLVCVTLFFFIVRFI